MAGIFVAEQKWAATGQKETLNVSVNPGRFRAM